MLMCCYNNILILSSSYSYSSLMYPGVLILIIMSHDIITSLPRLFYFLWQIAKAWLDPVTANKFVLLPPNQLDKLKVLLQ